MLPRVRLNVSLHLLELPCTEVLMESVSANVGVGGGRGGEGGGGGGREERRSEVSCKSRNPVCF